MKRFLQKIGVLRDSTPVTMIDDSGQEYTPWWGTFSLEEGQSRFWKIGNLVVCLDRFTNEWHIADFHDTSDSAEQEDAEIDVSKKPLQFKTFTFRTQNEVSLTPVLANRPLASSLERRLYIPAGEKIFLYVSSPLWVRVETVKPRVILDEIPTFLLSNTWFGPNTRQGKFCYAAKTYSASSLKELPASPVRVVTPMLIKNNSKDIMVLRQLSVPLPYMSVYTDAKNHLWTEQLNVKCVQAEELEVNIAKGPPKFVKGIKLLSKARDPGHTGSGLKHLFAAIWK